MRPPETRGLARQVMRDAAFFTVVSLSSGIGFMISHRPGSNELLLRWEPEKLVPCLFGALVLTVLFAAIRWWLAEPHEAGGRAADGRERG